MNQSQTQIQNLARLEALQHKGFRDLTQDQLWLVVVIFTFLSVFTKNRHLKLNQ